MSKALTTTGFRSWRYLVGVVALMAIVAFGTTFFGDAEHARADATITCGTADLDPPTGATTTLVVGQTVYCQATTVEDSLTVNWTVDTTSVATATVTNGTVITTVAAAPTTNASFTITGAGALVVAVAFTDGNGPHPSTQTGQTLAVGTVVGGTAGTVAAGLTNTVTFPIPAGLTYCSDPGVSGVARAFTAPDQTVVGLTVDTTTPDANLNTVDGTHTVTVLDDTTPGGTVSINLKPVGGVDPDDCFLNTVTLTAANFVLGELRHMSDVILGENEDVEVVAAQEVPNNVRGSRHVVCVVAQNTGIDLNRDGDYTDVGDVPASALAIPLGAIAQINFQAGGGYTAVTDPDPTHTDLQIFVGNGDPLHVVGGNGGLLGATCFSWVSTEAGDQEINLVYTGDDGITPFPVSWDSDNDNNDNDGTLSDGPTNRALIKEWNVLENSTVSATGGASGSGTGNSTTTPVLVLNVPAFFNPATSTYQFADVVLTDAFNGSHINRAGGKETHALVGVNWTASLVSGCGQLSGALTGTTKLDSDGSVFDNPVVTVSPGNCTSLSNTIAVRFTGTEPGPLGSGAGVTVTQDVIINLVVPPIPVKQVILAWAGQRVMVEHDWRLPPGDAPDPEDAIDTDPLGDCAFEPVIEGFDFAVQHIRGSGPGNFVPMTGTVIHGNDEAIALVEDNEQDGTISGSDQLIDGEWITSDDTDDGGLPGCISRVIYESEDQGQVDIELFVAGVDCDGEGLQIFCDEQLPENQTKVAVVIYYMKLNQVNVSLVTAVTKGALHNATNADFTPGNPWDASTDVTEADWNVSADLLVRGRLSGWFTNSNPSGRPRDDSDPNNVLPADRWVMPDDWARLQGGACGFDCRPEYDYMFAPNNTRGIALVNPEGTANTQIAQVAAGASTTVIPLTSASQAPAGATVIIGTSAATGTRVVVSRTGNVITVAALAAAPAAGTPVFLVGGTPFEGPISLLDIPGLAGAGRGGAALSDFDPGNIRDTMHGDLVLDWYDAPMPPTPVWVDINGAGFIKQVLKQDVYYLGTANSAAQTYPNPYYITDIPESPWLPAQVAGGGFLWDTWGLDGPGGGGQGVYRYWRATYIGTNPAGSAGQVISTALAAELAFARTTYVDNTIARRLTVFSDNHGEFMVIANGDANLTYDDCDVNLYSGKPHCAQGDVVGVSTISATADYPDFRGKHFPVSTNTATVNWTWGGYKEITVEDGETEQFKYIVIHILDRDAACQGLVTTTGRVSLHPVLGETIEWLIDSDEGGRFVDGAANKSIAVTNEDADTTTYTTALTEAQLGHKKFPTLHDSAVECQSWVRVSNSLLGRTNVFVIANDPEGDIGFDVILDFTDTITYTLNFRWSLITWAGADGISPSDALSGTGANAGGTNILSEVTAVYGWQQASQTWLSFFPDGVGIPGVNDLTALQEGDAYWIAIRGPNSITWTVVTDVN